MDNRFLDRFQALWARRRRVQFGQAVALTLLLGVVAFGLLMVADYALELGLTARVLTLVAATAAVLAVGIRAVLDAVRSGSRPRTAADVEDAFPELGQSVRTTVQFSSMPEEAIRADGVAGSMVDALAVQTTERTRPLGLESVIPMRRLWAVTAGLVAAVLLLGAASGVSWQWRTAAHRAMLSNPAYRSLQVTPESHVVDEGSGDQISVALVGRTNRDVLFLTRPAGRTDAEWTEQTLERTEATAPSTPERPRAEFVAKLDRLIEPLEYRITAGDIEAGPFRIDIRRPVKISSLKVELTPPEYTRLPTAALSDGNVSALSGTAARFLIAFDKPVKSAALVFSPRVATEDGKPGEPEVMPLALDAAGGNSGGSVAMALEKDRTYSIVAEAADGTHLARNKYRIRIRDDQPPQVSFESPTDSIEVHSLAELPVRVNVRDDYGLTKSGVVFQVNNEQEIPLIAEDFAAVVEAATEIEKTGQMSPKTQAALERLLPLEHFALTQKDSVMYFAFAEDNRPGMPQRTETDMRFIDIRPFKRTYQIIDPDPMPGGMNNGPGLKSLEELIQRQRFGLNRTLQIERRALAGRTPDAVVLDQLMKFETELAGNVRDTALGLEARGFDDTELFYQAESAILQAVDSLSVGKWENASLQMRDALKFLIEQRDRTLETIRKNPDAARLAQIRAFDRQQAQKLRRPKTDKEEARELIARLEALASKQESVKSGLASPPPATPASDTPPPESPAPAAEAPPAGEATSDTTPPPAEGETK